MMAKKQVMCVCGKPFSEHTRIDMSRYSLGRKYIYVCPRNKSGIMPEIFKKRK